MKINYLNKSNGIKALLPVIILVVIMIFLLVKNIVQVKESQIRSLLSKEAAAIENVLLERFNSTFLIIRKMGKDIAQNPHDKIYIKKILEKYRSDIFLNQIYSWTIFSWADQNSQLIVDGERGIMKNPINISMRDYIPAAISNPGKMLLGKPVYGSTSKKWMIPGGVSIVDSKQEFMGTITIGFEIDGLLKIVQRAIKNHDINIELVNNKSPVFRIEKLFAKIFSLQDSNFSNETSDNNHNSFSVNLEGYPYDLVLTYDKQAASLILEQNIYSRLIEISIIFLLIIILLITIYKNFIKEEAKKKRIAILMQREVEINKSRSELMLQVGSELKNFVAAIIGLSDIIKENLAGEESKDDHNIKGELEHLRHIDDISQELMSFIVDLTDLNQLEDGKFKINRSSSEVNFEEMVDGSIRILSNKIKEKGVRINTDFDHNLNRITNLDSRRIKQIIISVLGNAVKYSPNMAKIDISIINLSKGRVKIIIKDYGVGMDSTRISRALSDYDSKEYRSGSKAESIELKLQIVRFLIEKQGGAIRISSIKDYGTEVKIIF